MYTTCLFCNRDLGRNEVVEAGPVLRVPVAQARQARSLPWYRYDRKGEPEELRGDAAIRAAGALLPRMNQRGSSADDVQRAVE